MVLTIPSGIGIENVPDCIVTFPGKKCPIKLIRLILFCCVIKTGQKRPKSASKTVSLTFRFVSHLSVMITLLWAMPAMAQRIQFPSTIPAPATGSANNSPGLLTSQMASPYPSNTSPSTTYPPSSTYSPPSSTYQIARHL